MTNRAQSEDLYYAYGIRCKYGKLRNEIFFVKPDNSVLTDGETVVTIKVLKTTITTYEEVTEDEFPD